MHWSSGTRSELQWAKPVATTTSAFFAFCNYNIRGFPDYGKGWQDLSGELWRVTTASTQAHRFSNNRIKDDSPVGEGDVAGDDGAPRRKRLRVKGVFCPTPYNVPYRKLLLATTAASRTCQKLRCVQEDVMPELGSQTARQVGRTNADRPALERPMRGIAPAQDMVEGLHRHSCYGCIAI
jgi:hypothetical protein